MAEHKAIISKGVLPKNGEEFSVVVQTIDDLEEVARLHQEVFDSLDDSEKAYLIERDKGFFESHFEEGHVVLGVVHNGRLVAQALMTMPSEQYPSTGMTDMDLRSIPLEKVAVLNGAIVHPEYRGNKLQRVLTEARVTLAEMQGRTHFISEVAVSNTFSWDTLMKSKLHIHSIGTDPDDGTLLYNMHIDADTRKVRKDFNRSARRKTISCSQSNIEAQQILMSLGFRGVANDIKTQTIEFAKAPKAKKRKACGP